jgi:hypothetical protein
MSGLDGLGWPNPADEPETFPRKKRVLSIGCDGLFGIGPAMRDAVMNARCDYAWRCPECGRTGEIKGAKGWDSRAEGDARFDHGVATGQRCAGKPVVHRIPNAELRDRSGSGTPIPNQPTKLP